MTIFNEAISLSLAGRTVKAAYLVKFDFTTEVVRLWTGWGELNSGGFTWSGLGELSSINGLEQSLNGEAPSTTFTLSGIDATITTAARDEFQAEARGRVVEVYLQFFNNTDDRPAGDPVQVWAGKIETAQFTIPEDGTRSLSVVAESIFALRSRPNFSYYSSSDQKNRHPTDKGFDFVPSLKNKVVTWPDY